jgi:hypothetical protein
MVIDRFDSLSPIGTGKPPIVVLHGKRPRRPGALRPPLVQRGTRAEGGWSCPRPGTRGLARYGDLDAAVAFIERRLGG